MKKKTTSLWQNLRKMKNIKGSLNIFKNLSRRKENLGQIHYNLINDNATCVNDHGEIAAQVSIFTKNLVILNELKGEMPSKNFIMGAIEYISSNFY